jgi:S-DNA-T family DNA segregation ATPase FtsK/SpoIIIE
VQSTLGAMLAAWRHRLRQFFQDLALARARRRERRQKERARRRVITKHLQRVVEEKQEEQRRRTQEVAPPVAAKTAPALVPSAPPPGGPLDLPLWPQRGTAAAAGVRIAERRGESDFAVRRVSATEHRENQEYRAVEEAVRAPAPAEPGPRPRPRAAVPQRDLPFPGDGTPGALPPVNLLQMSESQSAVDEAELVRLGETIRTRCGEFGVEGTVEAIAPGPVITVFEFQPAPGVKVSHIVNLQDDLALALRAESVRIDRLPGRSTLGLEVPNRERRVIRLGSLLADDKFRKA